MKDIFLIRTDLMKKNEIFSWIERSQMDLPMLPRLLLTYEVLRAKRKPLHSPFLTFLAVPLKLATVNRFHMHPPDLSLANRIHKYLSLNTYLTSKVYMGWYIHTNTSFCNWLFSLQVLEISPWQFLFQWQQSLARVHHDIQPFSSW